MLVNLIKNLKYNTIQAYKTIINKYIKPKIRKYKLSTLTSVSLNTFIIDLVNEYDFSRVYYYSLLIIKKNVIIE